MHDEMRGKQMIIRFVLAIISSVAFTFAAWAASSPPPSLAPFVPQTYGVRPVVAAGLHYIYSLDATNYQVYRRNADGTPGAVVQARKGLWWIFQPMITKLDLNTTYPSSTGIKPCPAASSYGPVDPDSSGYVPASKVACIESAYDSDVYYDPQTKRIWILAHLRPSIKKCPNQIGYYTLAESATTCHVVAPSVLNKVLHRYIAVAVSRPGAASSDVEDPANGFKSYILVDDYADWSQLMVHNGLVLVNSRDLATNNRLYVWGANDLITNAVIPNNAILPTPSAKFDNSNFNGAAVDWVNGKTVQVQLATAMMFVRQQTDAKVTYLLSGTADGKMVVYGLISNLGSTGQMPAPSLIMPAVVALPEAMPPLQKASGAYADGFLYWGWAVPDPANTNRSFIRTFRWEVHQAGHTWNGVHPIHITNSAASGYLESDIGRTDTTRSWVLPTMNAAPNGDVVTMFHTFPASQSPNGPYAGSVRYAVLRKGQIWYDASYLLAAAKGTSIYPPHRGGVLDIVSVATDPLIAGQYILGNAFTDATGGWTHVIAGVKP